jgi:tetratricopeptide (TPR) repeat protein/serine/threonine protein kinase
MNLEGNPRSGQREPAKLHAVFVSYSSADNVMAEAICAALESEQIKCWMAPRDVQGGRAYAGQITQAIREAPIFLLILSGTANRSKHVLREVERAAHCQNHLLTFRTEAIAPSDDLTYYLGADQWIDGFKPLPPTQHFPALIEHTRRLLKSSLIESEPEESDDSTPQTFAHFRILKRPDGSLFKLGKGGMGVTYKAIDSNLNRTVALKVVSAELLRSPQARQRFLREAQAAANIRHPHVATIYHFGEEEGTYFYAMEFIEGEDLERYIIRQGPLSPAIALRVGLQVAQALEAAQARKLIHRDIKPSNIMAETNRFGSLDVKLIDFGLAKGAGAESQDAARISRTGDFVGSPAFASPEQCETKKLDIRSDIYSLGVTLWYLLSGKRPFSGSFGEVMIAQAVKPPPFDQLAHVPELVLVLLRRMLEKSPDARFQTPQELQDAVEAAAKQLAAEFATVPDRIAKPDLSQAEVESDAALVKEPDVQPAAATGALSPGFERYFEIEAGSVLGSRYRLLEEAREGIGGRLFRVRDQDAEDSSELGLKLVHPGIVADPAMVDLVDNEIDLIRQAIHPNLVGYVRMERSGPFLIREWVHGFLLYDLLRWRGSLNPGDLATLLEPLAVTLDFVASNGLGLVDVSIRKILVVCPKEIASADFETFARMDPGNNRAWSRFALKLNPLSLAPLLFRRRNDLDLQTMVPSSRVLSMKQAEAGLRGTNAVRLYGWLVYELLSGHALPRRKSRSYIPLASLDQEGNSVLQRACTASGSEAGFRDSRDFWNALKPALAQSGRPSPLLEPRHSVPPDPPPAQKASLQPVSGAGTPPPLPRAEGSFSTIKRPAQSLSEPAVSRSKGAASRRRLLIVSALVAVPALTAAVVLSWFVHFGTEPVKPTPVPTPTMTPVWSPTPVTPNNEELAQPAFQRGFDASAKGDYQAAVTAYTEVIRLKPDYAEALNNQGWAYGNLGQWEKAVADFTEAIRVKPEYAEAYSGRGWAYYSTNQYQNAVNDCTEAIRLKPDAGRAYVLRGDAYVGLDKDGNAISDYAEAIRLSPDRAPAYFKLAMVYSKQSDYSEAIPNYSDAIQRQPNFPEAYYNRGFAYSELKQYEKAIGDYTEAIRLKSDYAFAYKSRGWAYCALEEWEKAISDLTEAIRLKSDYDDAYDTRGWAYDGLKQWEKALSDRNEAIRLQPSNASAYSGRAWTYGQLGQWDKAISDCTEAIRLDPKFVGAYRNRAWAYERSEQREKAISDRTQVIKLNPNDATDYHARANTHYNDAKYEQAVSDYTEAIRLKPDYAEAYDDRGDAYGKLGRSSEAAKDHKKAKELKGR